MTATDPVVLAAQAGDPPLPGLPAPPRYPIYHPPTSVTISFSANFNLDAEDAWPDGIPTGAAATAAALARDIQQEYHSVDLWLREWDLLYELDWRDVLISVAPHGVVSYDWRDPTKVRVIREAGT